MNTCSIQDFELHLQASNEDDPIQPDEKLVGKEKAKDH